MAEELGDKTEAPTPQRRAEARRDGNVARSADLAAAVLCLATLLLLRQYGPGVVAAMKLIMIESFAGAVPSAGRLGYLLGSSMLPLILGLVLIAIAANLLQTGLLFGFRKKTGVFDPSAGFARIFSGRSAAQLTFNLLKLALVAVVIFVSGRGRVGELLTIANDPSGDLIGSAGSLVFAVGIRTAVALVVLGAIDFGYQRARHERELRMTRREVKEELRRQEGDAAMKRRRRQISRARNQAAEGSRA